MSAAPSIAVRARSGITKALFIATHLPTLRRIRQELGAAGSIHTDLTTDERVLLYMRAAKVPAAGVILEIGSYLGASTCILAAASRPGVRVYAVDTWQNEGMAEGLRDTFDEFLGNTRQYEEKIRPLRGRSTDVVRAFDREIDLLFIDGDHSYEGCKDDLRDWLPLLKPGGTVILHDTGWAEGVKRATAEEVAPRAMGGVNQLPNTAWARIGKPAASAGGR